MIDVTHADSVQALKQAGRTVVLVSIIHVSFLHNLLLVTWSLSYFNAQ